jgi:vacuolar-type H+-ATPase subunit C/Vma6
LAELTTEQYGWGFASGRVSALEGKLLGRDFFQTLLAQARPEDVLRLLQDTPIGASLTPGAVWDDCSALIDRHFYAQLQSLRGDSPEAAPADLFQLQADYLNLKRALLRQEGAPLAGRFSPETLARVAAGDYAELPESLRARLSAIAEMDDAERRQLLDAVLDGAYLEEFLATADALDVPLLREYAETFVLSRAIVALWRAQRTGQPVKRIRDRFLPVGRFTPLLEELMAAGDPLAWPGIVGGDLGLFLAEALEQPEDERIPRFDRLSAERLARIAGQGRYQAFGPERVFAYFAALATEAYNLKVVVCGRMSRIDADLLRQRLRETYG